MILALVLVITGVLRFAVLGGLAHLAAVTGSLTLDIGSGRRLRALGAADVATRTGDRKDRPPAARVPYVGPRVPALHVNYERRCRHAADIDVTDRCWQAMLGRGVHCPGSQRIQP